LFLGLEGWDQHHCNPLAKLLLAHVTRALLLAPAGNCRACVGRRSTPSACTSCRTGCVAQLFFWKTWCRGAPRGRNICEIGCTYHTQVSS
jgi:hypothetical protein